MKRIWLVLFFSLLYSQLWAQEESGSSEEFHRHKVMIVLGHTHVANGFNSKGDKAWIVLPSWGLDYDFRLNANWSIGLHSEMVIESFEYESENQIKLDRTRPVALVVVGSRKIGKHLTILAGGGTELAPEENLTLIRVGADYSWELINNWELAVNVMTDFKLDAYDSWVFGLGVAKIF
ncbi:hypothetical protein [Reichenbachiella ulvae]|uniref:Outer membrane protein beta-barrel domain-containing protein n=1 Tax=Reichenbachiella ulvae TaxID=2980104 RepID=A0ABT3CQE3_9BACT|nr:hypothetical protein [Reichenbachiella ulvae]MCV9385859.1 hypothetical protein [Reichenbachiella ulvae]